MVIQESLYISVTVSLVGELINPSSVCSKINPSPVRWSQCFSSPSPVYHKLSSNPVRQPDYFSSPSPTYYKTNPSPVMQPEYFTIRNPIYHKVNPSPLKTVRGFSKSKQNDVIKLNSNISQLQLTLMNYRNNKNLCLLFIVKSYLNCY